GTVDARRDPRTPGDCTLLFDLLGTRNHAVETIGRCCRDHRLAPDARSAHPGLDRPGNCDLRGISELHWLNIARLAPAIPRWGYTKRELDRKDTHAKHDALDASRTFPVFHGLGRQPLHTPAAALWGTREPCRLADQLPVGHLRLRTGPRPAHRRGTLGRLRSQTTDHRRADLLSPGQPHHPAGRHLGKPALHRPLLRRAGRGHRHVRWYL